MGEIKVIPPPMGGTKFRDRYGRARLAEIESGETGLRVKNRKGEWVDVADVEGAYVRDPSVSFTEVAEHFDLSPAVMRKLRNEFGWDELRAKVMRLYKAGREHLNAAMVLRRLGEVARTDLRVATVPLTPDEQEMTALLTDAKASALAVGRKGMALANHAAMRLGDLDAIDEKSEDEIRAMLRDFRMVQDVAERSQKFIDRVLPKGEDVESDESRAFLADMRAALDEMREKYPRAKVIDAKAEVIDAVQPV